MQLILASQSPRRRKLLSSLGYDFIVDPSGSEEVFDESLPIDEALKQVALAKAREVLSRHPDDIVLAADTIVYDNNQILGKPQTKEEAFETLKSLSGRSHEVKTAVVVVGHGRELAWTETSRVHFRKLSDLEIKDYVELGTCLDKAGSYGIQDVDFVDHTEGSYSNVIGLPISRTNLLLSEIQSDPAVNF